MYNTLLYIGLTLMSVGFLGWVVSIIMERHYEVKLWELEQKRKKMSSEVREKNGVLGDAWKKREKEYGRK